MVSSSHSFHLMVGAVHMKQLQPQRPKPHRDSLPFYLLGSMDGISSASDFQHHDYLLRPFSFRPSYRGDTRERVMGDDKRAMMVDHKQCLYRTGLSNFFPFLGYAVHPTPICDLCLSLYTPPFAHSSHCPACLMNGGHDEMNVQPTRPFHPSPTLAI